MKTILSIEIKDNKTVSTLTRIINGESNILLHKTYGSREISNKHSVQYDINIIKSIKDDLEINNLFEQIDESYLTINTNQVAVETKNIELKYDSNLNEVKEFYRNKLVKQYPNLKITKLDIFAQEASLTKKKGTLIIEFIKEEYLKEIVDQFAAKDIKFKKIVPLIETIKNATLLETERNETALSIVVEEKFTQLLIVQSGKVSSSIKWDTGLTDIYSHISKNMNIEKQAAKKLFKAFGSIPPEDVIDDKVIHNRTVGKETKYFTKKDLSTYITEKVNGLFSNIKAVIDPLKETRKIKLIFNGEIKALLGFKKYASEAFAEPNIKKYNKTLIGLNEETEFITMGLLETIKKENNLYKKEILNTEKIDVSRPKITVLNKLFKIYNYI